MTSYIEYIKKVLSISAACKNCIYLLLKYLTNKNSFWDEDSWFHIVLALYFTVN